MGSHSRRPTRVPLLTALHKALLLSWAREHYHWNVNDWQHVSWSDESRFQLYRTDARVRRLGIRFGRGHLGRGDLLLEACASGRKMACHRPSQFRISQLDRNRAGTPYYQTLHLSERNVIWFIGPLLTGYDNGRR
ncbi:hypothetical protein AVEN_70880-1 [Araneus ventricosus]|uniref:Transposase Tc1-like domain-containing protein n=1 Tax=Araneus ventricosus TaxID=182803 RepID=A0A4Y2L9X0_ARAVE|nr:hypothetical protein AVEN_70880-1 [Araneus ventricosus]